MGMLPYKSLLFFVDKKLVISAGYILFGCWHAYCNKNRIHGETIVTHFFNTI